MQWIVLALHNIIIIPTLVSCTTYVYEFLAVAKHTLTHMRKIIMHTRMELAGGFKGLMTPNTDVFTFSMIISPHIIL